MFVKQFTRGSQNAAAAVPFLLKDAYEESEMGSYGILERNTGRYFSADAPAYAANIVANYGVEVSEEIADHLKQSENQQIARKTLAEASGTKEAARFSRLKGDLEFKN